MERPWVVRATTTLSIVVYLAVGVAAFMANETKPCESSAAPAAAADDPCTEPLTFIDALYMSIITITTVGYGDFSPQGTGMKVFTILYILVGTTCAPPPLSHTVVPALPHRTIPLHVHILQQIHACACTGTPFSI